MKEKFLNVLRQSRYLRERSTDMKEKLLNATRDGDTVLVPADLVSYAAYDAAKVLAENWASVWADAEKTGSFNPQELRRMVLTDIDEVIKTLDLWKVAVLSEIVSSETSAFAYRTKECWRVGVLTDPREEDPCYGDRRFAEIELQRRTKENTNQVFAVWHYPKGILGSTLPTPVEVRHDMDVFVYQP